MQDYRVELDVYEGPLDLLLYLIRRDEIEIQDIPIAQITDQYLQYLQTLKHLDINLAGEFLVMAATLMEIKAACLLPRSEPDAGEEALPASEDPTDPRYELIQQLLAYKRFKDAATGLDEQRQLFARRYARSPIAGADDAEVPLLDMEDVQIWDLIEAYQRVIEQVGEAALHEVVDDDTPIELHADDIVDRLRRDGPMTLQQMFEGRQTRSELIGLFMAMLELIRQRRLRVWQDRPNRVIRLKLTTPTGDPLPEPADTHPLAEHTSPDPSDPNAFDWPDAETRQRYEQRLERRAAGQRVEEDEQLAQDIAELEARERNELGTTDKDASAESEPKSNDD